MDSNLPNFLIVGASKCGTTTLASYLNQNSEVFICEPKEPKFLTYSFLKKKYKGPGDEYTLKKCIKTIEEYESLFSSASNKLMKGEASVDMLFYHKEVIPIIKKTLDNPKIIIMLREPSLRAFSAYKHLVRDGREKESFEMGLFKEKDRLDHDYEFIWAYKEESMYCDSVASYLNNFSDVKIIIFEEFINNQQQVVNETLDFLGVNDYHSIKEVYTNYSGKPKSKRIHNFFLKDNIIKTLLKKIANDNIKSKVKNFIFSKNLTKINQDKDVINNLSLSYTKEIERLEQLIKKDLSIWN